MTPKKKIRFIYIKVQRYIFKRKFLPVFEGLLKGFKWSTGYNYDYLIGDYENKETMDLFCSWLKADTVLYDLGANVGYYSLIANLYISKGKIYSFEPMPANIEIFNQHLRLNKDRIVNKSINLLPYAVSDKEKEVVFSNNDQATEGNTYVNSVLQARSSKDLVVKCYSIDGLLESGYQKPDVLKIDVEGAEYDVLRGAEKTLIQYRPKILLATHDCHLPGVEKLCVDFLKGLGYDLKLMDSDNKVMAGLNDYIAVHKENIIE